MQSILTIPTTVTTAMIVVSRAIMEIKEWGTWKKAVTKIVAIKQDVDAMNAVNSIKKCDTKMMKII